MNDTSFEVIEEQWIPMQDGRRFAARLWMPSICPSQPAPAILEFLPYRKRDGTSQRDESTYPLFARAGYVGVRVDISGHGESDGEWDDEYSERELTDCCEVIDWITRQPWSDGSVGMMGISWGGFNSLQVAALQPPALKAVIAIGTTVDRYNDDIHYKNGCLLNSNFGWSSTMLCFASRPPDPELVGDRWKEMWLNRLNTQPFPLQTWLAHQRRDDYWKHGSVGESWDRISIPSLVISGWADGYINAPPAAAANLENCKAVNGPWIHKYPHFAWPKPRMDFVNEAIRWWDRWLKGIDNGVADLPAYRAYMSEQVAPLPLRPSEPGRWVAEKHWPSPDIQYQLYYLGQESDLGNVPGNGHLSISSPLDCGTAAGEFFTSRPDGDLAADQGRDDAGSLVFDLATLDQSMDILGRPKINLKVAINRKQGNLAVRLNDVHPDGQVNRVSWGVLNLSHRRSNEYPEPMTPGQYEDIEIHLDECGYCFRPGHQIRVAVSTSYWPMIAPPPQVVTASIELGKGTFLSLPVRQTSNDIEIDAPQDPDPLPGYPLKQPSEVLRRLEHDFQTTESRYRVVEDTGLVENPVHGMLYRNRHEISWTIADNDPLSYRSDALFTNWMQRGPWSVRTESSSSLRCDASNFYIKARVQAFEGDELVNERVWDELQIPRDCL